MTGSTPAATAGKPSVLFVCVSNRGKSQMAAALMDHRAQGAVKVHSAGTHATEDKPVNAESAAAVAELGADMSGGVPKGIDPDLLRRVDRVVVVGTTAHVEPVEGMTGRIETWPTDEPSERGIVGRQRMCLIRDEIARRVEQLHGELTG